MLCDDIVRIDALDEWAQRLLRSAVRARVCVEIRRTRLSCNNDERRRERTPTTTERGTGSRGAMDQWREQVPWLDAK